MICHQDAPDIQNQFCPEIRTCEDYVALITAIVQGLGEGHRQEYT